VIPGDRVAKMKLVEQLTLVTLQTARSWIDLAEIRVSVRNHRSWPASTDFCNKICTFETCRRTEPSVHQGRAEIAVAAPGEDLRGLVG
jgi:hypothetical protein